MVPGPGTTARDPRSWLLSSLHLGPAHMAAVARRPGSGPLTIHRYTAGPRPGPRRGPDTDEGDPHVTGAGAIREGVQSRCWR